MRTACDNIEMHGNILESGGRAVAREQAKPGLQSGSCKKATVQRAVGAAGVRSGWPSDQYVKGPRICNPILGAEPTCREREHMARTSSSGEEGDHGGTVRARGVANPRDDRANREGALLRSPTPHRLDHQAGGVGGEGKPARAELARIEGRRVEPEEGGNRRVHMASPWKAGDNFMEGELHPERDGPIAAGEVAGDGRPGSDIGPNPAGERCGRSGQPGSRCRTQGQRLRQ